MFNPELYKDATILILGGGTSTLDAKWENLPYTSLWTCNDFFLNERIQQVKVDLVTIAYVTDIDNEQLRARLLRDTPRLFYEPEHYRGKQHTLPLRVFCEEFGVEPVNIPMKTKAGAAARLVMLALQTEAKAIYFAGVDGFDPAFSNKHAFTGHKGLKDTDMRRTYRGIPDGFYEIFTDAYRQYLKMPNPERLQNLGEGQPYNIGTEISQEHFPLTEETKAFIA